MTNKKELLTKISIFLSITIGCFLLVYLPLFCTGKTFVWAVDGVQQHYSFLKYLSSHSLSQLLGGIDLVGAVGTDTLINYLYYGLFDPFYLIAHILPSSWTVVSYELIVILKFLSSAIIMFCYLRHKKVTFFTSTIFSTVYMLSGYALVMFARHPMLACGTMYLPLLVWGVEKVCEKKRPYLFLIANVLLLLSNFYMFYMCAIFVVIYALCYTWGTGKKIVSKESILTYLYIAGLYVVTALLCAIILLPFAYGFLTSARGANKGFVLPTVNVYLQLFMGLFSPINAQNFYVIGISFLVLILLLFGVFGGKNKTYKVLSIVMIACLLVPVVGYIMNAFNYVSGRWFYLFIFTAIVESALVVEEWKVSKPTIETIVKVVKSFLVVIVAIGALGVMVCSANGLREANVGNVWQALIYLVILGVGIGAGCFVAMTQYTNKVVCYIQNKIKNNREKKIETKNNRSIFTLKTLQVATLVICVLVGFGYNIYYGSQFRSTKEIKQLTTSSQDCYLAEQYQETFFRVDKSHKIGKNYFDNYENKGLVNGYASTYNYNTVSNGYVYDWLKSIGQAGYTHTLGMGGLQGRLAPNAILSTKYYVTQDATLFGYEKVETEENILTNTNALPFGYVYSSTMSEEEYFALPLEERANALLQACIVENGTTNVVFKKRATQVTTTQTVTNMSIENGMIVADKNASLTITFDGENFAECILVLKNFDFDHKADGLDKKVVNMTTPQIKVTSGQSEIIQNLYDKGAQMYNGITDFVFPLGMIEGQSSVTLTFTQGEYKFDDIAIFAYNKEDYISDISKLSEHLTDVKLTNNELTSNLTTLGGQLFLSLPYTKGWTAYVDGVETKIDRCNVGFMGLQVSEGTHNIKLVYHTPYLTQGKWITVLSAVVLSIAIITTESVVAVKQKRRKDETK